jgi:hypothetical protein
VARVAQFASNQHQLILAANMYSVDSIRGYGTPYKVQTGGTGSYAYMNYWLENYLEKGLISPAENRAYSQAWLCPSAEAPNWSTLPSGLELFSSTRTPQKFVESVAPALGNSTTGQRSPRIIDTIPNPAEVVMLGNSQPSNNDETLDDGDMDFDHSDSKLFFHPNDVLNLTYVDGHTAAFRRDISDQRFVYPTAQWKRFVDYQP